jgi:small GTP-binding protein
MNEVNYIFKVAVVGDGRVGKTSLIKKFTQGSFEKEYIETIGAQLSSYIEEIDGYRIKLLFWDIAGEDSFHFLRPAFFNNSSAAIIVYSLEENKLGEESFSNLPDWYAEVLRYCGKIPTIVFANKVDLINEDDLDNSVIEEHVNNGKFLGYYITSAKTGQGVTEAFSTIIKKLYSIHKAIPAES